MKIIHILFICLCMSLSLNIIAQQDKRPVKIDDYFDIKSVSNPQVSPDQAWVAYTITTTDLKKDKRETRIWMVSTKGGEPIPMTSKGYSSGNPKWSPDGKYLSFTASREKGKPSQVWTLNRLGGEAEQLTNIKQGVSGYEWSPDGKKLLLILKDPKPELLTKDPKDDKKPKPHVIDRLQFKRDYSGYLDRRRSHLYIFTPGDTAAVQITSGDFDDRSPAWSPDGSQIAFVSNRSEDPDASGDTNIWIVDPHNKDKGTSLKQITTNPREDHSPAWSPDGKYLTYVTVTAPKRVMWYATEHLAIIPSQGGEHQVLTESLDRNVSSPQFSADGKKIIFELEDSGEFQLASISPQGKNFQRIIKDGLALRAYHQVGDYIAAQISRPNLPYEIFAYQNQKLNQLTFTNQQMLDKLKLVQPENIHFKSENGTEVEGFVYKPLDYKAGQKYPTILKIHGGPVGQYSFSFRFDPQLYAANGYVVIETNPRGSSGYGQDFSMALHSAWGEPDYKDVMAGVDYLIEQGIADPGKLGVGGWSYGGILTNYVITKTDRFKAAVSGASCALYRANYGHDHYQRQWEEELGLPWDNPEVWEKLSPFNQVQKITTPTLWMGGALDWNVPIQNSEQMYQAMKRLGRETQLVVYPGEHHGIRKPSFQKDRFERYLGWYNKYIREISE